MIDAYLSQNETPKRNFLVIMYCGNSPIKVQYVDADTYTDAVIGVAPGNDLVKIEVISL